MPRYFICAINGTTGDERVIGMTEPGCPMDFNQLLDETRQKLGPDFNLLRFDPLQGDADMPITPQFNVEEIDRRLYVNALPESADASSYVALLITAVHRTSGREQAIDALLPDDRLQTVLNMIRQTLGADWTLLESSPIEEFTLVAVAA